MLPVFLAGHSEPRSVPAHLVSVFALSSALSDRRSRRNDCHSRIDGAGHAKSEAIAEPSEQTELLPALRHGAGGHYATLHSS